MAMRGLRENRLASALTTLGVAGIDGMMGIIIGVVLTVAAATVIPRVRPNFGVPHMSIPAILIAFVVSLGIGVAAGCHPANRAAQLRPIESLSHQ